MRHILLIKFWFDEQLERNEHRKQHPNESLPFSAEEEKKLDLIFFIFSAVRGRWHRCRVDVQ